MLGLRNWRMSSYLKSPACCYLSTWRLKSASLHPPGCAWWRWCRMLSRWCRGTPSWRPSSECGSSWSECLMYTVVLLFSRDSLGLGGTQKWTKFDLRKLLHCMLIKLFAILWLLRSLLPLTPGSRCNCRPPKMVNCMVGGSLEANFAWSRYVWCFYFFFPVSVLFNMRVFFSIHRNCE